MITDIKTLEKEEQLTEDSDNEVQSIYGRSEGKHADQIKVYLKPDEMSDSGMLNFSYEVKQFTSTQMHLQLAFENKLHISISPSPEQLIIEFNDFKDEAGNLSVNDHTITKQIPNQLEEETASIIETTANFVGITMNVQYLFSVLTNSGLGTLVSSI